jgi:hypothetical protein
MRNATKKGGAVKYQTGGPMMKPTKIAVPGSAKKITPAQKKAAMDKFMKTAPKKQKGGVIVASPIDGPRRKVAGSNMAKGGSLKMVNPSANPGLAKLPAPVRNKMGYAKRGGAKKYQGGGQGTIEQVRNSLAGIKKAGPRPATTPMGLSDKQLKEATDQMKVNSIRRDAGTVDFLGSGNGIPLKEATRVAVKQGELAKNTKRAAHPSDVLGKPKYLKKKGGQAHPGFKAVQAKIAAKSGVSKKAAGAILAASTRKASAKAKASNPRLKRVKG